MNNKIHFESFLLEANKKINELVLESYRAGINYGFAFAQASQQADGKNIEDLIGEWYDAKSVDS